MTIRRLCCVIAKFNIGILDTMTSTYLGENAALAERNIVVNASKLSHTSQTKVIKGERPNQRFKVHLAP